MEPQRYRCEAAHAHEELQALSRTHAAAERLRCVEQRRALDLERGRYAELAREAHRELGGDALG
tara:strand:+ start:310 stop:501 length:192 start_codon:yes stop_codon:yes gene_type:complete